MEPKTYAERQDCLGLAQDIHMAYTGSYPDLSDDDLGHAVSFIKRRLLGWSKAIGDRSYLFDSAVHTLLTVAAHEGTLAIQHREAWKAAK